MKILVQICLPAAVLLLAAGVATAQTSLQTDGRGNAVITGHGGTISSRGGTSVVSGPGGTIVSGPTAGTAGRAVPNRSFRPQTSAKTAKATGGAAVGISTNNGQRTVTCQGNDLTITGNHNVLTVLGTCGTLTVVGNDNVVRTAAVRRLSTPGNHNQVHWSGAAPAVSDLGTGNVLGAGK